ncbi:hypothetical protein Q4534_06945 [Cyclobacterium sp. 1_MG-2023]|uniref:hypothetical protein n=1 Tax=Cyclobacterium sp. 1_MG-2023 TaxID=3062681 RepID=UPI0026E40A9B|nr:hypothetical protein [Cyclobacterium sp. 1_MG-2023]MDO6437133.1 hypothetical protein [Cyclobacterium sp. 1_MG-2023]
MNKNSKTTPSSVKATRQSKDTKKREITLKASMIGNSMVNISLWDNDFEIGTIICPVEVYGINDLFYSILDKMLMGYLESGEYDKISEDERRGEK